MSATTTVVFADLTGSTGVFEAFGNAKATQAITKLTQWICGVCVAHRGRVIKTLGDGVLAVFPTGPTALAAVVELQRVHHKRIMEWPPKLRMRLKIGVACGELVEVEGDCYGDAVNVASRLSDLSGAEQIWATDTVTDQVSTPDDGVRFLSLGAVPIRGKAESRVVYRIEWQEDVNTQMLTAPGDLAQLQRPASSGAGRLELAWLDQSAAFGSAELPMHLGRTADAQFVVSDQRVSRLHARVDWNGGNFVLTDLSSYGTWVRFQGGAAASDATELALRRKDCVLHGSGEIALGAPFDDFTVPMVTFRVVGGA